MDQNLKDCEIEDNCGNILEKVGQSKLFKNAGVMAIAAIAIAISMIGLVILYTVGLKNDKIKYVAQKVKAAIFWNTFIRYILQSTLKLQISAITVIFIANRAGSMKSR